MQILRNCQQKDTRALKTGQKVVPFKLNIYKNSIY